MFNILKRRGREGFPFDLTGAPVPIVSDAAIATHIVGNGSFIPHVILDTSERHDVLSLIQHHEHFPPGDALSAWGSVSDPKKKIALMIRFERPMEVDIVLEFDIATQGSVVDMALRTRAIYLQAGKPGDRLSRAFDSSRIIVELGGEMPADKWQELWQHVIRKKLQANGMSRAEAKRSSLEYIKRVRESVKKPQANLGGAFYATGKDEGK